MAFVAPLVTGLGSALGGTSLTAGSLLGAGASVLGTISTIGAANYQAGVANNNAKIAEANAQSASDKAQKDQLASDQQTAALIGEQEAAQGASGLSVNGASQLRTRRSAQRLGRQDAESIRAQGDSNIQSYMQQAENYRAEASSQKASATGALIGGVFDAGSSLVGGAKSVKNSNRLRSVA